jgi:type IV pilus assembly protein PilM
MKNKVFGLDIGATSIKVVWLEKVGQEYSLDSVYTSPTPAKGMLSESPLDQEQVAQTIAKMLTDAAISSRSANIALPESQVFTRVIEMPLLSDKELSSAIYWEAEQYIPVPLSNITLDYKVLRRPDANDTLQKMDVLLVGAPTMLIDKYEKVLSMAGISIVSVETEILSVMRSVIFGENFPTSLVVHIGAINTSIAIVKNNTLVFTYSIPTGGLALTRSIASAFGFSIPQAEEYKKTYGLSNDNFEGKIAQATQPILMSIIAETKKALAFYNEKYVDSPVAQIVLSGGTAKLAGINNFFANNMGIETVSANPWKILGSQEVPKEILDDAPEYTIATGLAMRDYE